MPALSPSLTGPDVASRLQRAFPDRSRRDVDRLVRSCRADLAGHGDGPMPELVERLARQRLLDEEQRRA